MIASHALSIIPVAQVSLSRVSAGAVCGNAESPHGVWREPATTRPSAPIRVARWVANSRRCRTGLSAEIAKEDRPPAPSCRSRRGPATHKTAWSSRSSRRTRFDRRRLRRRRRHTSRRSREHRVRPAVLSDDMANRVSVAMQRVALPVRARSPVEEDSPLGAVPPRAVTGFELVLVDLVVERPEAEVESPSPWGAALASALAAANPPSRAATTRVRGMPLQAPTTAHRGAIASSARVVRAQMNAYHHADNRQAWL
jgi:hypothetical protein